MRLLLWLGLNSYTAPDGFKEFRGKLEELSKEKEEAINTQNFEKAAKIRDEEKKIKERIRKRKE